MMNQLPCRLAALTWLAIAAAATTHAASISYVGADLTTSGAWRTPSILKPLDSDGNNVYGSAGYLLTRSPAGDLFSNPTYASVVNLVSAFYGGAGTNPNYTTVDNPLGGTVKTGIWYAVGSFPNQEQDIARITVSQPASFRIGVLVDETDFIGISPGQLRVRQTVGGTGDSTLVNAMLEANLDTDWYFFNIVGAQPGDQFVISGTDSRVGAGPVASNGIGAIAFDNVAVPETSTYAAGLVLMAFAGGTWWRARRPVGTTDSGKAFPAVSLPVADMVADK